MTKNYFCLFLAFAIFYCPANAQTIPAKLDSLLSRTLDSMHNLLGNKGMGAAVQIPNGAIWSGGVGVSSQNPTVEVSTEHIFNIGSVNKTITAACILQMADEGLLSLDDSLHHWLDTFNFINPNINIRQLLRHQSGIYDVITAPNYQPVMGANPDSIWAFADVIKTFIKAPLFQPGANFSYSNTNYLLLGMIIEQVSGQPYHLEIRDRFLDPLGLSSFNMPPYEPYAQPVAHVWLHLNNDNILDDAHDLISNWASWHSSAGPAGAYFSSPADIAHWMHRFMSGTLLTPAMMAAMKTAVNTPFNGGTKYGLGIMERNILNQKAYGHGGDAGYSASVWYFPNKDVSIAVLNNDGTKNSWTLIPTVAALLKTWNDYQNQVVGSSEPSASRFEVAVFPNPFAEQITVSAQLPDGASELHLSLTDATGQKVAESTFKSNGTTGKSQQFTLGNLAQLPIGIYFLNAVTDGRQYAGQQLVVKN
jgi:D-alanyl-D-alanine carboxypeptidase